MITFTIYSVKCGRIERRITCPEFAVEAQVAEGEDWMLGDANDARDYVVVDAAGIPAITPRPTLSVAFEGAPLPANGLDVVALRNLPIPCHVAYQGPGFRLEGEVLEGEALFTTDAVGPHRVTVRAWPYLDWSEAFDAI